MTPLLLFAVLGCENVVRFPPDPRIIDTALPRTGGTQGTTTPTTTGADGVPLHITELRWGCDISDAMLEVQVFLSDPAEVSTEVTAYGPGEPSWIESHPAADPVEPWHRMRRVGPLSDQTEPEQWVPGESTTFDCTVDVPELSLVARVWTDTDHQLADCVMVNPRRVVMDDLQADPEVLALGGCLVLLTAE